jgi:hypothetical protein
MRCTDVTRLGWVMKHGEHYTHEYKIVKEMEADPILTSVMKNKKGLSPFLWPR